MGTHQQLEKIEIDELILHSSTIQFSTKVVNLGVALANQQKMTEQVSSLCRLCFFPAASNSDNQADLDVGFNKDTRECLHQQSPRLLQLIVVWRRRRLDRPAAACAECCGTARIWRQEIRPHHTDNDGFALAADSTASDIHDGHHGLQRSPWLRSRLPRRRLRRCFFDSWSSVFAFGGELTVPWTRTMTSGPRAFFVCGPTVWNSLPCTLRSPELSYNCFRKKLKTDLFLKSY